MTQSDSSHSQPENRFLPQKLLLWSVLLIATGLLFALAETRPATAYSLRTLATSSPISPLPKPTILKVDPAAGANSVVVTINIYGQYFTSGGKAYLQYSKDQTAPGGSTEYPRIPLRSEFVNSTHIIARVPLKVNGETLELGYYDVGIQFTKENPLFPRGYRIFDADTVNDLYAEPYHLISIPSTLKVGDPVDLSLKVHRMGGVSGTGFFDVSFYVNQVHNDTFIGKGRVTGISPDGSGNSSPVRWTPSERGEVRLLAVIDSGNNVPETNEDNNTVLAVRQVRQKIVQDVYPPKVTDLTVNDGVETVKGRDVMAYATVTDGPDPANPDAAVSGPAYAYYVELHWYSGTGGGGVWIPVNWTNWLAYGPEDHPFTLHPTPGVRALQAWGSDVAGNISALPAVLEVTMLPASSDELSTGEIRVYRQKVTAGQCLTVRVTPTESDMDPDLYMWAPDGTALEPSINGSGEQDQIVIFPTVAGRYQIEVEGYTEASYTISVDVTNRCTVARTHEDRTLSAKTKRTLPAIPVAESAEANEAPAPQEELKQYLSFMSQIGSRSGLPDEPAGAERVYIPAIQR